MCEKVIARFFRGSKLDLIFWNPAGQVRDRFGVSENFGQRFKASPGNALICKVFSWRKVPESNQKDGGQWTQLAGKGAALSYQRTKSVISGYQRTKSVISGCQRTKSIISGYQRTKLVISSYQRSCTVVSSYQRPKSVVPGCRRPRPFVSSYHRTWSVFPLCWVGPSSAVTDGERPIRSETSLQKDFPKQPADTLPSKVGANIDWGDQCIATTEVCFDQRAKSHLIWDHEPWHFTECTSNGAMSEHHQEICSYLLLIVSKWDK